MARAVVKPALFRMSVEEENLASIPFAVLESRVGKRISKIEITGTKILPDGQELRVAWQVQGNAEFGLPTEQDLDIFVALGVLTFRNNFAKTVTFTGRELAKLLGINGVHGKFYQRLKLAMDRFVPLRFRAISATDRQEQVKWINVFQEASFTLDRETGRCTGSVTWTDKLIHSMNNGFFRVLDAGRYMDLDGITVKHMYRFLAVAFEKTDVIIIDARKLAAQHLGILKLPKYFSRLMQTLEPAFDQLIRIEVLGSYHVTSAENWEVALHRHASYVPERKTLLLRDNSFDPENIREKTRQALITAGMDASDAERYTQAAREWAEYYQLQRAGALLTSFLEFGVLPHVAVAVIERALTDGFRESCRTQLDWCEIAIDTCKAKIDAGQKLKNPAGLMVRIARDPDARSKMVLESKAAAARNQYRQREQQLFAENHEAKQRRLVLEYENSRLDLASTVFDDMSELAQEALCAAQADMLRQQGRYERMDPSTRISEIKQMALAELAKREAPPFEKWLLRKRAAQALLPFGDVESVARTAVR